VRLSRWFSVLALAGLLGGGGQGLSAEKKSAKEISSFGTLRAPAPEEAREQAKAWLQASGKTDAATQQEFEQVWKSDRSLLDKVTATLLLGDENARQLLAEARNPSSAAPTAVPAVLKDAKLAPFYRANLGLAYARALAGRRIYEETLDSLKAVKPEQVVDPAAYLFTRAVAEHALLLKPESQETIARLLDDVPDAPERYRMVASLMHFDMLTWRDKDLGWIARKMDNIERRLELARGGQTTQKMQKEVVARLDELIKQMENQSKGGS